MSPGRLGFQKGTSASPSTDHTRASLRRAVASLSRQLEWSDGTKNCEGSLLSPSVQSVLSTTGLHWAASFQKARPTHKSNLRQGMASGVNKWTTSGQETCRSLTNSVAVKAESHEACHSEPRQCQSSGTLWPGRRGCPNRAVSFPEAARNEHPGVRARSC